MWSILSFLLGLFLGGILVYWLRRAVLVANTLQYTSEIEKWQIRFEECKKSSENSQALLLQLQTQFAQQMRGLSTEALDKNSSSFLDLANQVFEKFHEKAKGELEKKEEKLSALLNPIKTSMEKFDLKIGELEKSRLGAYSALTEQVKGLLQTQVQLRKETNQLVNALRTPHVRGRWGEIQLRRVVELAGMVDHCDFYEQASVTKDDQQYRPDLVVKLPGKKNVIVDAKAPLEAYLEAIECQDEEKRVQKLQEHARQIRNHMVQLGRKSYWEQFSSTPEFVILFLPAETFFSAALEQDPSLIEVGVKLNVILATPTTLIALLRSVAYGWRQESISANAAQISLLGKELYKRLADMGSHWSKVGKSLSQAVSAYNKAIGSLETRVLVSARRFKELESVGTDGEIEIVEPIDESTRELSAPELGVSPSSPSFP